MSERKHSLDPDIDGRVVGCSIPVKTAGGRRERGGVSSVRGHQRRTLKPLKRCITMARVWSQLEQVGRMTTMMCKMFINNRKS